MIVSITCPVCGMTSYSPRDVEEGYCGNCHDWTTPLETDEEEEEPIAPWHENPKEWRD